LEFFSGQNASPASAEAHVSFFKSVFLDEQHQQQKKSEKQILAKKETARKKRKMKQRFSMTTKL
jgi:hypothetical protein